MEGQLKRLPESPGHGTEQGVALSKGLREHNTRAGRVQQQPEGREQARAGGGVVQGKGSEHCPLPTPFPAPQCLPGSPWERGTLAPPHFLGKADSQTTGPVPHPCPATGPGVGRPPCTPPLSRH